MGEELVKKEVVEIESPSQLIALALERQADPNTLSKLMDLQERWEAGRSRKAFVAAMTAFKQEAPAVLKKNDQVDFTTAKGRTHYNYANLGSIVQEITAILGKHELSASWSTSQEGNNVTVTCHVTHIAGHRESVALTGPIDESGNKNRIQAVGSTVTYLQRYTLLAALGLATGEDEDGTGGEKPPLKEPQKKTEEGKSEVKKIKTVVLKVEPREKETEVDGKKKISKWFIIHTEGDVSYRTFSETFKATAEVGQKSMLFVEIDYTVSKYGNEIQAIKIIPDEVDKG